MSFSNVRLYLVIFLCGLSSIGLTQPFSWVSQIGGSGTDAVVNLEIDVFDNVYSVGYFDDSVDFDPGDGVEMFYSNGGSDGFIQKLSKNGDYLWTVTLGGLNYDNVRDVATDSEGDVYITGGFDGTVDFDPSDIGVEERTAMGSTDAFLMKLSSDGELIWVHTYGNELVDYGYHIEVTEDDDLVVTGSFTLSIDFDLGVGVSMRDASLARDVFCLKLSSDGDFQWVQSTGLSTQNEGPGGMAVSLEGDVYTVGGFRDSLDLDPGVGTFYVYQDGFGNDLFVQKLNADGEFVWGYGITGNGSDGVYDVEVDNDGNAIIVGSFSFDVSFNPADVDEITSSAGNSDGFIQKIDSDGNQIWLQHLGGEELDQCYGLAVDPANNIFVTGTFTGTVDFDFGPGTEELETIALRDAFVYKMNEDGEFIDAFSFAGNGYNLGYTMEAPELDVFYAAGYFSDTVDFDRSAGTAILYENTLPSSSADAYVVRYAPVVEDNGVAENEHSLISIFPNPTNDNLTVKMDSQESYTIKVINLLGEELLYKKGSGIQETLNVSHFAVGTYCVLVQFENGAVVQEKFVVGN